MNVTKQKKYLFSFWNKLIFHGFSALYFNSNYLPNRIFSLDQLRVVVNRTFFWTKNYSVSLQKYNNIYSILAFLCDIIENSIVACRISVFIFAENEKTRYELFRIKYLIIFYPTLYEIPLFFVMFEILER